MGNYKLSLLSKRLRSGKCQIKFEVTTLERKLLHGYLLSEAGATLREVVDKIEQTVKVSVEGDRLSHAHLYNLHKKQPQTDVVIFKS